MDERNPYKTTHSKETLSVELNFRSFLMGEGGAFFERVSVEDLVSFASLGCPITIPASAPYSDEEPQQIAGAVRKGGGKLNILSSTKYPAEVLKKLELEAPGQIALS